jgi:hypothetical protein
MRKVSILALALCAFPAVAHAEIETFDRDIRFCRSWAEAHERTSAGLNGGRKPAGARWKGCIWIRKGAPVDVVAHDEWSTEIVVDGVHWFADE